MHILGHPLVKLPLAHWNHTRELLGCYSRVLLNPGLSHSFHSCSSMSTGLTRIHKSKSWASTPGDREPDVRGQRGAKLSAELRKIVSDTCQPHPSSIANQEEFLSFSVSIRTHAVCWPVTSVRRQERSRGTLGESPRANVQGIKIEIEIYR